MITETKRSGFASLRDKKIIAPEGLKVGSEGVARGVINREYYTWDTKRQFRIVMDIKDPQEGGVRPKKRYYLAEYQQIKYNLYISYKISFLCSILVSLTT